MPASQAMCVWLEVWLEDLFQIVMTTATFLWLSGVWNPAIHSNMIMCLQASTASHKYHAYSLRWAQGFLRCPPPARFDP